MKQVGGKWWWQKAVDKELKEAKKKRETGQFDIEKTEIPVTLKIDEHTDAVVNLRGPSVDEKVIKVSKSWKVRTPWIESLFFGKPRHYCKFLCLTTDRVCFPIVTYNNAHKKWDATYDKFFDFPTVNLVSAYAKKATGRDWLIINSRGSVTETFQIKFPVENSDEWVKEITSVIEKEKG